MLPGDCFAPLRRPTQVLAMTWLGHDCLTPVTQNAGHRYVIARNEMECVLDVTKQSPYYRVLIWECVG